MDSTSRPILLASVALALSSLGCRSQQERSAQSMRSASESSSSSSWMPDPSPPSIAVGRHQQDSSALPPSPKPANYRGRIQGSDVEFDMVWIAEGGFWIGKFEVTWDEYLLYCAFAGDPVPPDADAVSKPSKPLETFPYDREWGTGRRPAVGMSWNAAKKYCQWLSRNTGQVYRLPNEAEWRLACGDAPAGDLGDSAWYDDNSGDMTHEVGSKEPNAHGLYDMLGNLWEYTADPFDPEQPQFAALRGGSWADPDSDATPDARLAFDEFWILPDPNVPPGVWWVPDGDHLGFRLLRPGSDLKQGERGTP